MATKRKKKVNQWGAKNSWGVSPKFIENNKEALGVDEMIELNKLNSNPSKQLSVSQMARNPIYAKELRPIVLKKIMKSFNLEALGMPIVCDVRVENPKVPYELIDGNHRVHVVRGLFGETTKIQCIVLPYMSLEDRAKLYTDLNQVRSNPSRVELFKAKLVQGDEETLGIYKICQSVGVKISGIDSTGFPTTRAIINLESAYRRGTLSQLLIVVRDAYSERTSEYRKKSFGAKFLAKLDNFLHIYFDDLDWERVVQKVGAITPIEWEQRLGSIVHTEPTGASAFVVEYNKGMMKNNKLDMSKVHIPMKEYKERVKRILVLPPTKATTGYGLK